MKKFQVKFQTIESNGIVTMYIKADCVVSCVSKLAEMFNVKVIKLVKEESNESAE